jgi:hypothetical protein
MEQAYAVEKALAIMGGLRTLATDLLNTYAHLLLTALIIRKWCH